VKTQGKQRTIPESTSTASSDSNTSTPPVARVPRDKAYYSRIGKKGGDRTKEKYGSEYLQNLAQKGGQANAKKRKPDHFSKIGQKGGETTKKRNDPGYYGKIGQTGGKKSRRKKENPQEPDTSGPDM
jgi:general stress protein YciG